MICLMCGVVGILVQDKFPVVKWFPPVFVHVLHVLVLVRVLSWRARLAGDGTSRWWWYVAEQVLS